MHLQGGESIACGTERRHEGGRDRHTRDNISFAARAYGNNPRTSTEESYKHVINGGRGACQQFTVSFGHWGNQKVKGGGEHREQSGDHQVSQRAFEQLEIGYPYPEADADNRSHERGYQHRADDYGGRVGVQAE